MLTILTFPRAFSEWGQNCCPRRYRVMAAMELVTVREPLPHLNYKIQIPSYLKRWGM